MIVVMGAITTASTTLARSSPTWTSNPRLELLNGAGCSPHDNPAERTDLGRAEKLIYVANAAVDQPGRLRQIHSFFCNRSPDQMLDTAAPWTKPLTLPVTSRTSGMLHR